MTQIIVYKNSNNGVAVCRPTGELPIEEVLIKDCPPDAIIVDDSILPTGADAQFFNAWELNGSIITVNFSKAQAIKLAQYNSATLAVAQNRQLNTLAGIPNTISDADWQAKLIADRNSIASSTTTEELIKINNPT